MAGMDVVNSAVVTVNVDLTLQSQGLNSSPNTVLAAIQSDMTVDGFTIGKTSLGLSALLFAINGGEFSATIQIINQSGQDCDDSDIENSFRGACSQEGINVNSYESLQVVGPSTGANSGTGAAGNVQTSGAGNAAALAAKNPTGVPQCGDPALVWWKYPTEWASCLTNKGLTTVGLLAIGLLLGVVLIVMAQRRPTPV